MHKLFGLMPVLFSLFISVLFVDLARAFSVTYSYKGSNFVEMAGEPGIFSTSDRVTAKFTIDCAAAHSLGDCRNLPYDDYAELGAVQLEPLSFSAGPASLPTSDGSVEIAQFSFSTDSNARIVDWDLDLFLNDPLLNVDTDSVGGGFDSAAALGGSALVAEQPGTWENDPPAVESDFDITVSKSVDNPAPAGPQQTVEFTITVNNSGPDPITNVVVMDKLPPELAIPEGMAAFTSTGYYDPLSGRWEVGDIEPGLPPEIMTLPVAINSASQPVCVVNTASSNVSGDTNTSNNSSSVALRRPDIQRCVDIGVELSHGYQSSYPCAGDGFLTYRMGVSNSGPDSAQNVVLEITETLYQVPGFRVDAPNCDGLRCAWDILGADQHVSVTATTDRFGVQAPTEHGIKALVSSDVEDYALENNSLIYTLTIHPVSGTCAGSNMDFDIGAGAGAGAGCFIATASYGSKLHPHVQALREFRDDILLKTDWGRALVDFYYRHSPDLACYIAEHDTVRMLTRGLLLPVVYTVAYPWQALLVLFAALVCLVLVWRRAKA